MTTKPQSRREPDARTRADDRIVAIAPSKRPQPRTAGDGAGFSKKLALARPFVAEPTD